MRRARRAGEAIAAVRAVPWVATMLATAVAGCTVVHQPPPPAIAPPRATIAALASEPASDAAPAATAAELPSATAAPTRPSGSLFDPDDTRVSLERVATGLDEPVHASGNGVDATRLYVVEKGGAIRIVDLSTGALVEEPFVDLTERVRSTASEQGLLSVAFHPDFAANSRLFVNYTRRDGSTVIAELAADADRLHADPAGEREVLVIDQPAANHNGGQNAFGPDGYLYLGMGDGGGSGAGPNAQDPSSLLGKVLRLDVDGPPGGYRVPADNPFVDGPFRPEVWSYGLRNPWRLSFDRATGDLFIADVGDSTWEEVSWQPAASGGGENYGWPDVEGDHCHGGGDGGGDGGQDGGDGGVPGAGDLGACDPGGRTTRPIAEYRHEDGNCAVSGGFVYRGRRSPALDGVYLYADYCSGRLWGAWRSPGGAWHDALLSDTDHAISAFGQDDAGEVYALDMASGEVLRVVADGS